LNCDLSPLKPEEWLEADLAFRNELVEASNTYYAVYGPIVERHRENRRQQHEAEQRAKARR